MTGTPCEFAFDGRQRRYRHVRPPHARPDAPLLVELHGSGLSPELQMRCSGFHHLAARHGFEIAAPEAAIPFTLPGHDARGFAWHVPGAPLFGEDGARDDLPDDIGFVAALIDRIAPRPRPILLAGFSGGARLASHLMLAPGNRIAGAAMVGGLLCPPLDGAAEPPPIIAFHGRRDTLNPYEGCGGDPRWPLGIEATVQAFARHFGWRAAPGPAADDRLGLVHRDAQGKVRLLVHALRRGGHDWPGSRDADHRRLFGSSAGHIDASEEIWRFFEDCSAADYARPIGGMDDHDGA